MTSLHTMYLGLELRSPIVASAGPATGDLETAVRLEEAGAGARQGPVHQGPWSQCGPLCTSYSD